mmetsp:Transcript_26949/g.93539  ORF Transcript_26949/g.93539 Transcript_26949/m.93539 type:complete len:203 (+) Transcript_26949:606-1214(+)
MPKSSGPARPSDRCTPMSTTDDPSARRARPPMRSTSPPSSGDATAEMMYGMPITWPAVIAALLFLAAHTALVSAGRQQLPWQMNMLTSSDWATLLKGSTQPYTTTHANVSSQKLRWNSRTSFRCISSSSPPCSFDPASSRILSARRSSGTIKMAHITDAAQMKVPKKSVSGTPGTPSWCAHSDASHGETLSLTTEPTRAMES